MTELGNKLREAREAKGLSLEDLQNITKIQKRYLVGIEEGNYEMMPGKFYVRAFIKQYCEAVGLDPDEIFEEFKSEVPGSLHDDMPDHLSRVKSRKNISTERSKTAEMLPKIVGAVLIIGVAVLIYVLVTNMMSNSNDSNDKNATQSEKIGFNESKEFTEEKKTNDTKTKTNEDAKMNEEDQTIEKQTKTEQELTVVTSSGKNSTYELKNTDAFTVKLVSTGSAWVGVTNTDGKYLYQGTMSTEQTQEIDAKEESSIVINVGRAQAVEIYVNDEKLEYAVSPTEELSQLITIQYTKAK